MTPRVLVTGGTGFLGLPCVRRLAAAGAEVHVATRHQSPELPSGVSSHLIDLLEHIRELVPRLDRLVRHVRPTHLLHLAWVTAPGAYWTSPSNVDWLTVSSNLLTSFGLAGGRRAMIAGTCAEYDWTGDGVCREDSRLAPFTTPYSLAKSQLRHGAEMWANKNIREAVEIWAEKGDRSLAWPRLFFLYGPREHPARLVPFVTNALLDDRPAECTPGTQRRDFLHVEDAADALVQLLLSDLTGPVNIGAGEAVPVRTVVETIADIVGRPDLLRLGAKPLPPNDPPLLVADVGRLRNELGWHPRIALRQGLEDTVAWWRSRRAA